MSRVKVDMFKKFRPSFQRELYERVYDITNEVHYENTVRNRGDVSVLLQETLNTTLGIEPDFEYELHIVEGSENWPTGDHDEVKSVLDERALRISSALREIFPGPSHAVMENAGNATGWTTYNGDSALLVPAHYRRRSRPVL